MMNLLDALSDAVKMIPALLIIYYIVEWFERRLGNPIESRLQKAAKLGPALGAVFGGIPQCGFSVVASALYTRRLVTIGTLLAVFLATSDEAVPVILAQPENGKIVIALLITKLIIGLVGGYAVDLLFQSYRRQSVHQRQVLIDEIDERGCCKHRLSGPTNRWQWVTHPLIHTAKIFFFIVAVTFGINYLISLVGEVNLGKAMLRQSILQPFLSALVGLIPNCAASVAITEAFLKGGLSYGSAIAGLCSSSGVGMLVLFKENHDARDTIKILFLLVGISTAVGTAIHLLYG